MTTKVTVTAVEPAAAAPTMADPLSPAELFREARHFAIAQGIAYAVKHEVPVEACVGQPKCHRDHSKEFIPCKWCFRIERCEDRTVDEIDEAIQNHSRGH